MVEIQRLFFCIYLCASYMFTQEHLSFFDNVAKYHITFKGFQFDMWIKKKKKNVYKNL